jgi:hypothetical protein
VGSGPSSVTAADVNGDGSMDLICANYNDNALTVLTNNGSGHFTVASTPAVGDSPQCVTAADVNGDGKVDLISANANDNTLTILTNAGSGQFTIASSPAAGAGSCGVVATDVNGDGHVDLVSANFYDDTLTVLTNTPVSIASFAGNGSGLNWGTTAYVPTLGDGVNNFTTSTAQGDYSQMGNVTFVEIWLVWTGKGSASAASPLYISLPFASSSPRAMFTLGFVNGITSTNQLVANANLGSAKINLWRFVSGGGPATIPVSSCATSGEIQLSGFFRR